ncbi:SPOR domain-containing protein [Mucilaginibacter aquariorum]|uniref:SPOR domain-containing protein n=1 Tax=Mucilaginibacter aquariorum TaxID=2967225 RepID=A0ABT1T2I9_9SPHI|nr:SPOR domain-containing protein [Mucilaginibacter aquariorum]MCQ6958163.1 SPOR domain-containing protein [Mucilaginibacter aquariorum]
MDVGYFISELLAQNGNVSVPGLGNFTHTRINGHYNEKEGKLYPPTYSVQFDPQEVDDVTLVQYIADRKNISLASSQYFTDKFINGIKLQAQSAEAPLADLGWFYTQDAQLFFKLNTEVSTDPDFFGYQPVKLRKLGAAPADTLATSTVNYSAPVAVPAEVDNEQEFETNEEHEAYLVKQSHKRRRNSILTFVTLAVLLTALAVYLVNKYNPSAFNPQASQPKAQKQPVITTRVDTTEEKDTTKIVLPADTTAPVKNTPTKDTLSKISTFATDSLSTRWEVLGGTFKKLEEANRSLKNYKTLGVEARLVQGVPDRRFRITLGTYKTRAEAAKAIRELLKEKKVSKDIYPLEIKPKL